jgi:polyhydroxyalkanoate synthesis regulator phasin
MLKDKAQGMVDRLVSRYDLTSQERVAMANLIRELVKENQTLKATISNLGWQLNSDRQGGL